MAATLQQSHLIPLSPPIPPALTGIAAQHDYLSPSPDQHLLLRSDLASFRTSHTTIVAFAGGGHEPMFAGFVGPGFCSAFVSGAVFASPTAAQILAGIDACQSDKGTLVVCGNYTGDVLNAGLAITRARARGRKVEFVAVGDDVAVGRAKGGKVGRRGLSGHLVALKAACALAEEGAGLEAVSGVCRYVAANVGTVGVAFDRVALPDAVLTPLQRLPADTIELGMGAHGEPGLRRISPVPELGPLVAEMLDLLLDTTDKDRSFVPFSKSRWPAVAVDKVYDSGGEEQGPPGADNHVVLLLNSLGSTSDAFLARVAELAIEDLASRGFVTRRMILGPLVTSLKMSGFGITLWRLPPAGARTELLDRDQALTMWDRPVTCDAWRQ